LHFHRRASLRYSQEQLNEDEYSGVLSDDDQNDDQQQDEEDIYENSEENTYQSGLP
jgi:hypothetical protein